MRSLCPIAFAGILIVIFFLMAQPLQSANEFRARVSKKSFAREVTQADVEAEIEFGREVAARILGQYKVVRDKKITTYVNLVGKAVAIHCNRPELDFKFAVLNTSSINAYAAPGGYIFVTAGAVKIMKDEAELAGVLAHEIAHSTERHIVKELGIKGEESSAQAGIAHLLGAMGDPARMAFKQAVDKAMDILFTTGYQQQDEFEADRSGTLLLASTGYDPLALERYIARLSAQPISADMKIINDTHPSYDKRQAAFRALAAEYHLDTVKHPALQERFAAYVN